jgi:hypothetical protein
LKEGLNSAVRLFGSQLRFCHILAIKPWAYALGVTFQNSLFSVVKCSYLSQGAEKIKRVIPYSRSNLDVFMKLYTILTTV